MNLRRILAAVLGPLGYVVWRKSSGKTYAWDGLMTIHDAGFMQVYNPLTGTFLRNRAA